MKVLKTIIATVALSTAFMTTAQARDSFSLGINIGTHGYHHDHHRRHSVITHRHAPSYHHYHYAPRVYAPRVVYYEPRYRYRAYDGDRHFRRHLKKHGHDHKRKYYKRSHRWHHDH